MSYQKDLVVNIIKLYCFYYISKILLRQDLRVKYPESDRSFFTHAPLDECNISW